MDEVKISIRITVSIVKPINTSIPRVVSEPTSRTLRIFVAEDVPAVAVKVVEPGALLLTFRSNLPRPTAVPFVNDQQPGS